MTDRELFTRALNYLQLPGAYAYIDGIKALREEIRARLAEPEDEPVRWLSSTGKVYRDKMAALMNDNFNEPIPLYRRPPRNPVHLSNTEIRCIIKNVVPDFTVSESVTFRAVARAIEQNVLEKNK